MSGFIFRFKTFCKQICTVVLYFRSKKRLFDAFPVKKRKELTFSKCLPEFALIIILTYSFIIWIPVKIIFFCVFFFFCDLCKENVSKTRCDRLKIAFIAWKFYLRVNAITKNLGDALFHSSVWTFAQCN